MARRVMERMVLANVQHVCFEQAAVAVAVLLSFVPDFPFLETKLPHVRQVPAHLSEFVRGKYDLFSDDYTQECH